MGTERMLAVHHALPRVRRPVQLARAGRGGKKGRSARSNSETSPAQHMQRHLTGAERRPGNCVPEECASAILRVGIRLTAATCKAARHRFCMEAMPGVSPTRDNPDNREPCVSSAWSPSDGKTADTTPRQLRTQKPLEVEQEPSRDTVLAVVAPITDRKSTWQQASSLRRSTCCGGSPTQAWDAIDHENRVAVGPTAPTNSAKRRARARTQR